MTIQGNIENVACGQYHTIVIIKNPKDTYNAYVFGDNKHGQLDFFFKTSKIRLFQPTHIPLSNARLRAPIQVQTGWSHTNILSSN